jgi:hypothetical protein
MRPAAVSCCPAVHFLNFRGRVSQVSPAGPASHCSQAEAASSAGPAHASSHSCMTDAGEGRQAGAQHSGGTAATLPLLIAAAACCLPRLSAGQPQKLPAGPLGPPDQSSKLRGGHAGGQLLPGCWRPAGSVEGGQAGARARAGGGGGLRPRESLQPSRWFKLCSRGLLLSRRPLSPC